MARDFSMKIDVRVNDEQAVLHAAARQLVAQKAVPNFSVGMSEIGGDLSKAITYLLDPGATIAGLEIHDSFTEEMVR